MTAPVSQPSPQPSTRIEWEARFWKKVDKSGDCWLWIAGKDAYGYGQFSIGFKKVKPHRLSYEMAKGPIPEGMVIDHRCHNRVCVNPAHLRAITQKQNTENRSEATSGAAGFRGVTLRPSGRFVVQVKHNQQRHYGGTFNTIEEAAEAARQLRLQLFTHNDLDRKAS